jgi:uncharacterized protein
MRIHVQSLPLEQDHPVHFHIPSSTMVDDNPNHKDITPLFMTPVECDVVLRKMPGDEVFMTFEAKTVIEPICDRCTVSFQVPFKVQSSLLCRPLTRDPTLAEEEDEGLVLFTKQEIFLDKIIREQIFLALPIQNVCDEECQGLCPGCGENLNDGEHECSKRPKFVEHKAKVL